MKMTVCKWWSALVALACFSIHRPATCSAARQLVLRPHPSSDLGAIPDLIETPNPALDPRPSDMNITSLLAKLGGKFDTNYMSVASPEHMVPITGLPFRRNRRGRLVPSGKMPDEIRDMDTKYFTMPDGRRLRTRISGQLRRKIQQFMWGRTMCPMQRRWKDLGQRFWPRWLLEGHCIKGATSCSIPAGMYCRATDNQYKTLLRWHCRGPSPSALLQQYNTLQLGGAKAQATPANQSSKVCQWIKVEYPVITECGCGCGAGDQDDSE